MPSCPLVSPASTVSEAIIASWPSASVVNEKKIPDRRKATRPNNDAASPATSAATSSAGSNAMPCRKVRIATA